MPSKEAILRASKKYDAENTISFSIKLNRKTDADILAALEGKPRQTEVKRLVRLALEQEKSE